LFSSSASLQPPTGEAGGVATPCQWDVVLSARSTAGVVNIDESRYIRNEIAVRSLGMPHAIEFRIH
jgi:hypothetical protein